MDLIRVGPPLTLITSFSGKSNLLSLPFPQITHFRSPSRIATLKLNDESELSWRDLTNETAWAYWSSHDLQRRWHSLKRAVEGSEQMPFYGNVFSLPSSSIGPRLNERFWFLLQKQWRSFWLNMLIHLLVLFR